MTHNGTASSDSGEGLYLPISVIFSALILSAAVFYAGSEIGGKLTLVSTSLNKVQLPSGQPTGGSGSGAGGGAGTVAGDDEPAPVAPIDMAKLADNDPVKGNANAKVTLIEFSDFQCPFCGRWFSEAYQQLKSQYLDTGKARLIYRDFPLSFHPEAKPAALAAECANEQGKFWEFHDKIFLNQATMSADSYKAWAKELGLDTPKFNSCLDSKKYDAEVNKDFSDGTAAGVSGTPTFFINGKKVVGAQPFEVFKQVIDAELAG